MRSWKKKENKTKTKKQKKRKQKQKQNTAARSSCHYLPRFHDLSYVLLKFVINGSLEEHF